MDILVREGEAFRDVTSVDGGLLHVLILLTIVTHLDSEDALGELDLRHIYERTADGVLGLPWADLIEAQRTEDVPS